MDGVPHIQIGQEFALRVPPAGRGRLAGAVRLDDRNGGDQKKGRPEAP
jgi:hypothetical protein